MSRWTDYGVMFVGTLCVCYTSKRRQRYLTRKSFGKILELTYNLERHIVFFVSSLINFNKKFLVNDDALF